MTGAQHSPTLSLAMIMKDEISDLERIIRDYQQYFDKIYVTVTDKKTHDKLIKNPPKTDKLELSYFKWIDHFGKARRYNQKQIKTDYWMWIDLDDEIEGAENIPLVIDHMQKNELDAIWLRYSYILKEKYLGKESIFWRERIVKNDPRFTWKNKAVHEHIELKNDARQDFLTDIIVQHKKNELQVKASINRNMRILKDEWEKRKNPDAAFYLGTTFRELGNYEDAIEKFLYVTKKEGDPIRLFATWIHVFECYFEQNLYDKALYSAEKSISIDKTHPGPWYQKFVAHWARGEYEIALQSAETAMEKEIRPEHAIHMDQDPAWYQYKGPFEVARAYLEIGNIDKALELYEKVKRAAPSYINEVSAETGLNWNTIFEESLCTKEKRPA